MIKLEHLRQFQVTCQSNSLAEAAERLHRTPSAVSMTLKQIEAELGGPLFEGDRKRELTALGQFVYARAQRALGEYQRTLDDIADFARGDEGLLRVAAVPSAARQQLPEAIAHCLRARPALRIELRDSDSGAVQRAVLDGDADIGIASLPRDASALHHQLLHREPFVCLAHPQHPLARGRAPLRWRQLQPHRFIDNGLCAQIDHPAVRALSAAARLRVHNVASLLALVHRDLGVTLLPRSAVPDDCGLQPLALGDKRALRELYLMRRIDRTPAPATEHLIAAVLRQYGATEAH